MISPFHSTLFLHLLWYATLALAASDPPVERSPTPVPRLVWVFDGENEQTSSALPDSEAIDLVRRFGHVEGSPRGPRHMAFDRAGQARCAVAIDSAATLLSMGPGRTAVLAGGTVDLLDEQCQVRFSHPAESAAVLLDGAVLAVADEGQLLFLDPAGGARGSAKLRGAPILVAAADGGNLIAITSSLLTVFDPWGRQLGRIEPESKRTRRLVAGGPDRIYLAMGRGEPETRDDGEDGGEVLAAYALDGTLIWNEKLEPDLEVTGLWAWPDGRGALLAVAEHDADWQRVRERRLETRNPAGVIGWRLQLAVAVQPPGVEITFAGESGDVAVTLSDASSGTAGEVRRGRILILAPDGMVRGSLRVTALTRAGGGRLSTRGRYLLVNATDSGLLHVYGVP